MSDSEDDETKFNETLRRMLNTPPKPRRSKTEASSQRGEDMRNEKGGPAKRKLPKKQNRKP